MEFGGRSSIHGLSYVSDPLLPPWERLVWLFLFLASLAVYLNVSSYIAWRENMVVTNLGSTGRPVNNLDTVTICGGGLHMAEASLAATVLERTLLPVLRRIMTEMKVRTNLK